MADWRPALASLFLLGACSQGTGGEEVIDEADMIACATGGASEYTRNCSVERIVDGDRLELVVRHEDGGFRRLEVMRDGSGVITADGADSAAIALFDGEIEVTVGADRYLLPATIADDGQP